MATETRLRVGVIGLGFGARVHVPGFARLPETEVVTVCCTRRERAAAVATEHGVPGVSTDYRELLGDPAVEAVAVATPPHLHHPISVAALLAGKHVLCEKPLARTVAEARDMARQAEAAGLAAMVDHELRFLPARQEIKRLVDGGYLGELRTVNVTLFRPSLADPPGRVDGWLIDRDRGGGMLGAAGAHLIDALLWWFGPIAGVGGQLATAVPVRRDPAGGQPLAATADDTGAFVVRFASGALGSVHFSGVAWHGGGEHLEAYGSEGTLILTATGALLGARRGETAPRELPVPAPADLTAPPGAAPLLAPFMRLARAFAAWARDGAPRGPSFADGLRVQEVIGGIQRSSRDGQWVALGRAGRTPRAVAGRLSVG